MDTRYYVEVAMDGEVLWTFADLAADDRTHAAHTAIGLVAEALRYPRSDLAARARPVDATAPDEVRAYTTHATDAIDGLTAELARRSIPAAAAAEITTALDVARRSLSGIGANADAYRVSTARRVTRKRVAA